MRLLLLLAVLGAVNAACLVAPDSSGNVVIPSATTTIGDNAFSDCSLSLKSVTFGVNSQLESIGANAFSNSGLTFIVIPSLVTTIADEAFQGCSHLTSVTFESGASQLVSIGRGAFFNAGLTSFTVPASVTTIGASAFYDCSFLASVIIACGGASALTIHSTSFDTSLGVTSGVTTLALPATATYTGSVHTTTLLCPTIGTDCSTNVNICFDAGQYCDVENLAGQGAYKCQLARPGYYATGDGLQTACAAGYTTGIIGATSRSYCFACKPGYKAKGNMDGRGSGPEEGCVACPVGTWGDQGKECFKCLAGTYQPNLGSSSHRDCILAPAGKFVALEGSGSAEDCAAGSYAVNLATRECTPCHLGYVSAAGAARCSKCPPGHTAASRGETMCTICPAGTSTFPNFECTINPKGSFSEAGAKKYTLCPPGMVSEENGATECHACPAGKWAEAHTCHNCPAGRYSTEGLSDCIKCPTKHFSVDGASVCDRACDRE